VVVQSSAYQQQRTLAQAERFLEEVRQDLERARLAGLTTPPRLRSIHERPGHATPEYRTLMIPPLPGQHTLSPEVLSAAIACFAAKCPADRLVLVMDAERQDGDASSPVLIAEARDHAGTRLFLMQPYTCCDRGLTWATPVAGGWVDPGAEDMILDAAFSRPAGRRIGTSP
jgi:hypothetical protein